MNRPIPSGRLSLKTALLAGLCLLACCAPPSASLPPSLQRPDIPYDLESLFHLEPFGRPGLDEGFGKNAAVVTAISNLSCGTCVSRELKRIQAMSVAHGERLDFVLVVSGEDEYYLRNLRRVGRIRFPILLGRAPGPSTQKPDQMTIDLIDKNRRRLIYRFTPYPGPECAGDFQVFQTRALHYLEGAR